MKRPFRAESVSRVRRKSCMLCLGSAALICVAAACTNDNSYDSGTPAAKAAKKTLGAEAPKKSPTGGVRAKGEAVPRSDSSATFSGGVPFQSVASDAEAWVVTDNKATRIELNKPGYPKTEWTFSSSSPGNRTYVSELGLLIGRTNFDQASRGVWLAKRDQPGTAVKIYDPPDMRTQSRLSVTSFKIGNQPYIGMAYGTSGGNKKFVRIPIDRTKPNGIDETRKQEREYGALSQGVGGFGGVGNFAAYGSFMDQTKKAFYLGGGSGSGAWGVNVETMNELSLGDVPNGAIGAANRRVCGYTMATARGLSYALAGDLKGNIVSAGGAYTFAHDPQNDVIFGSSNSAGSFSVARQSCVAAGGTDCATGGGSCEVFPAVVVGPMSAVGDGRVVGIKRGNPSEVYLISLKDKNNLNSGIEVTSVTQIQGDAYMYNDFTGVTLYAPDQTRLIEFKTLKGFQAGKPVKQVLAGWSAQSKNTEDLRGLKLELACYKTGKPKPTYVDYSAQLKNSASLFALDVKDCSGDIDAIEVKLSSDGTTNNFTRLSTFEIRGAQ